MNLSEIKEWICSYLQSSCATPPTYTIAKPFHKTLCFFHKAICSTYDVLDKQIHDPKSLEKAVVAKHAIKSRCNLTHYFEYLFEKISSSSCNITTTRIKVPLISQSLDNTCEIADYFVIWRNEILNRTFSQVSRKPLSDQSYSYLNWCEIQDFATFWWSELHKTWCYLADCIEQQKMQLSFETGVSVIDKGRLPCEKWIRKWLIQNLGIEFPKNVNLTHLVIILCIPGGILFVFLLICKRIILKQNFGLTSVEKEDVQRLSLPEQAATVPENLENRSEENNQELLKIQSLNDKLELQRRELESKIDKFNEENLSKQRETDIQLSEQQKCFELLQEHAKKLKEEREEYQKQIVVLNHQINNLQEDRQTEIKTYLAESTKIQAELKEAQNQLNLVQRQFVETQTQLELSQRQLKETQNQLRETQSRFNLSQQLHEGDLIKLHENIAQLQAQDNRKTHRFNEQCQVYQKNLKEAQERLQKAEEVCNQQRDLIAALNKPTPVEISSKYFKNEEVFKKSEIVDQEEPYVVESLKKIDTIIEHTRELEREIEEFSGNREDMVYLHLKELLIRNTLKMDNVESEGHLSIRKKRKEGLEYVHKCMDMLESNVDT